MNLASGSRLNTFSRHLPLAVRPLHHRLSPSSAPRVPCKPASLELAAASGPSFLPPEAFDRPPSELIFRSSRLFLGKPLAVCITPVILLSGKVAVLCQRQAYARDCKQLKGKPRVVRELVINFYVLLH